MIKRVFGVFLGVLTLIIGIEFFQERQLMRYNKHNQLLVEENDFLVNEIERFEEISLNSEIINRYNHYHIRNDLYDIEELKYFNQDMEYDELVPKNNDFWVRYQYSYLNDTEFLFYINDVSDKLRKSSIFISHSSTYGSGIIYKKDLTYYYALTDYDVANIDESDVNYDIRLYNDQITIGEVIASDQDLDLSVIRFQMSEDLPITPIKDDTNLNESVFVVGSTYHLQNIVLMTKISEFEPNLKYKLDTILYQKMGFTLVNLKGNIVGITTEKINDDYYATPHEVIVDFLNLYELW